VSKSGWTFQNGYNGCSSRPKIFIGSRNPESLGDRPDKRVRWMGM
jgi:hypothetical protein